MSVVVVDAAAPDELRSYRLEVLAGVVERFCAWQGQPVRREAAPPAQDGGLLLVPTQAHPTLDGVATSQLTVAGVRHEGPDWPSSSAGCSVAEALARSGAPAGLRYFALSARYSDEWIFTWSGLSAACGALEGLTDLVRGLGQAEPAATSSSESSELRQSFSEALSEDLDTPSALAAVWQGARSDLPPGERLALLLDFDRVLGLELAAAAQPPEADLPVAALGLIEDRAAARQARDFARSDALRAQLAELGIEALDAPTGSTYRRR